MSSNHHAENDCFLRVNFSNHHVFNIIGELGAQLRVFLTGALSLEVACSFTEWLTLMVAASGSNRCSTNCRWVSDVWWRRHRQAVQTPILGWLHSIDGIYLTTLHLKISILVPLGTNYMPMIRHGAIFCR